MERQWIFLINTFLVNTRNSFKLALTLFEDTYAKLAADAEHDADVAVMYNDFKPFYIAYRDLYAQKQSTLGIYEGETLNFETLLSEMPTQVRRWEGQVRALFIEDSPEERAIFPNKRNPFLQGTYEQRVSAVETLFFTLSKYPALSAVANMVETFYNRLEATRLTQQKQEGQSSKIGSLLEKQHLITCQEMYGVLGRLMYKFRYEPQRIADYMEIGLLRSKSGTGSIAAFKGKVTDAQDQPIANATVRLSDSGFEINTDENGLFDMEVESGLFDVLIFAVGYKTYEQRNVLFKKDETTELNVVLKV
jgi:hypothetical protein